jgi:ketosteroid isomerase-like protein
MARVSARVTFAGQRFVVARSIDTAIATGGFKGQGTDESGKAFNTHSRWTDTWVKMPDGKWQCVASHGSDIKK